MSGSSGPALFRGTRNSDGNVVKGTKRWRVPFQFNFTADWERPHDSSPGETDIDYAQFDFQGWGFRAWCFSGTGSGQATGSRSRDGITRFPTRSCTTNRRGPFPSMSPPKARGPCTSPAGTVTA